MRKWIWGIIIVLVAYNLIFKSADKTQPVFTSTGTISNPVSTISNYPQEKTFHTYECTQDCSGHQAGYEWAELHGIDDEDDCHGNSESFVEGCKAYVQENSEDTEDEESDEE